jgi:hypothetical protein
VHSIISSIFNLLAVKMPFCVLQVKQYMKDVLAPAAANEVCDLGRAQHHPHPPYMLVQEVGSQT